MPFTLWWIYNGSPFLMGFALAWVMALALFLGRKPVSSALAALLSTYRAGRSSSSKTASERMLTQFARRAQAAHLAGPWFRLEDIAVWPRFLLPPDRIDPLQPPDQHALPIPPFLLDAMELAAAFPSPTLSLNELLRLRSHTVISGEPGSGRSCALWLLLLLRLRDERSRSPSQPSIPIFPLDLPDLDLTDAEKDLLEPIRRALRGQADFHSSEALLEGLLQSARSGSLVLTVDSVDEASPEHTARLVRWVRAFIQEFPMVRFVVADSPGGSARWAALGFTRLPLAPWTRKQHQQFVQRWLAQWASRVSSLAPVLPASAEPALISGWLDPAQDLCTPLQATLRCWATCRGKPTTSGSALGWEAYLGSQISEGEILALTSLARRTVLGGGERLDPKQSVHPAEDTKSGIARTVPLERALDHARARGIVLRRRDGRVSFIHWDLAAFLAAKSFALAPPAGGLQRSDFHPLLELTFCHLAQTTDVSPLAQAMVSPAATATNEPQPGTRLPSDLAHTSDLLRLSRWLAGSGPPSSWKSETLRSLARILRSPTQPMPLRARCLCAFLRVEGEAISPLFQRMLAEDADPQGRMLAVLALGALRDSASLPALQSQLHSPDLSLARAAALSLARFLEPPASEALGTALLQGDMNLRRAAAEGLAQSPEEGHDLLREAAKDKDIMVRRSAAFGLARIDEPWAEDLLQEMQREDGQWAVRAAAGEALEALHGQDRLPKPPPVVWELPWLIAFAASRKVGVAAGEASYGILRRSLLEGSPLERAAAAQAMEQSGSDSFLPALLDALGDPEPAVRDCAWEAIWSLSQQAVIR